MSGNSIQMKTMVKSLKGLRRSYWYWSLIGRTILHSSLIGQNMLHCSLISWSVCFKTSLLGLSVTTLRRWTLSSTLPWSTTTVMHWYWSLIGQTMLHCFNTNPFRFLHWSLIDRNMLHWSIFGWSVWFRTIGDHTETVDIEFDPAVVNYEEMLQLFFKFHDATAPSPGCSRYFAREHNGNFSHRYYAWPSL